MIFVLIASILSSSPNLSNSKKAKQPEFILPNNERTELRAQLMIGSIDADMMRLEHYMKRAMEWKELQAIRGKRVWDFQYIEKLLEPFEIPDEGKKRMVKKGVEWLKDNQSNKLYGLGIYLYTIAFENGGTYRKTNINLARRKFGDFKGDLGYIVASFEKVMRDNPEIIAKSGTYYRGMKSIPEYEFKLLKPGQHIRIMPFTSASSDISTARNFRKEDPEDESGEVLSTSVLFEITIPSTLEADYYKVIDIQSFSDYPLEKEFLFFPLSLFYVEGVKEPLDGLGRAHINLLYLGWVCTTGTASRTLENYDNGLFRLLNSPISYIWWVLGRT